MSYFKNPWFIALSTMITKLGLICLFFVTLTLGLKCCHQEFVTKGNECMTEIECEGSCATQKTIGKSFILNSDQIHILKMSLLFLLLPNPETFFVYKSYSSKQDYWSYFCELFFANVILELSDSEKQAQLTVPIDRILSVKNARAWVSMDFT